MRSLLAASLILAVTVVAAAPASVAVPTLKVVSRAGDGTPLVANWTVGGRPPKVLPPPNPIVGPASAGGRRILSGVPSWTWCYGCSNTAAAMIMAYYDRGRYPKLYTGPAAGTVASSVKAAAAPIPGLCPLYNESAWPDSLPNTMDGESPLASSHMGYDGRTTKGHVDDWWFDYGTMFDPCRDTAPPWEPHTPNDCLGDFMWTSRADKGNPDGFTNFVLNLAGQRMVDYTSQEPTARDGMHGVKLFVESCGYSVKTVYTQIIWPAPAGFTNYTGFKFEDFMAEIDAGRPVMILCTNHTFVGYGYDADSQRIYTRTTWDNDTGDSHTVKWGEQYGGETMLVVGVIELNAPPPDPQPDMAVSDAHGFMLGESEFGDGQTAERKAMPLGTEEFLVQLANRGNLTDSFRLAAPPALPGWEVHYYRAADGAEVTDDITGAGWTTSPLPPYATEGLRVVVKALPGLAANALLTLTLTASSMANASRTDTVQAITTRVTSDLNGSGSVNEEDVRLFIAAWRNWVNGMLCDPRADMNASGTIGLEDARRFVDLYTTGN